MTRPLADSDLALLIGVLSLCEGQIMIGEGEALAHRMLQRWQASGVLDGDAGARELCQLLADLNQRVRHAKLEFDEPPESESVTRVAE